jgi:hypothetical protein
VKVKWVWSQYALALFAEAAASQPRKHPSLASNAEGYRNLYKFRNRGVDLELSRICRLFSYPANYDYLRPFELRRVHFASSFKLPHFSYTTRHASHHVYEYGKDSAAAGFHVQLCAATTEPWKFGHIAYHPGLKYTPCAARNETRNRRR